MCSIELPHRYITASDTKFCTGSRNSGARQVFPSNPTTKSEPAFCSIAGLFGVHGKKGEQQLLSWKQSSDTVA